MIYYKYTRIKFLQNALYNGAYASKLGSVNDPFEWEGIRYKDDYRICCLTTAKKSMLMWSYYANHRGCCIGFRFPKDVEEEILNKVDYTDMFRSHREMNSREIQNSLYQKGKEWEHEKEYRAVWYKNKASDDVWNYLGEEVYLKGKVESVCFGLLSEHDSDYIRILKSLHDYNLKREKNDQIAIKKCVLSNRKYELLYDPQYNYEKEL